MPRACFDIGDDDARHPMLVILFAFLPTSYSNSDVSNPNHRFYWLFRRRKNYHHLVTASSVAQGLQGRVIDK